MESRVREIKNILETEKDPEIDEMQNIEKRIKKSILKVIETQEKPRELVFDFIEPTEEFK